MKPRTPRKVLVVALTALLAACGGGGGDGDTTAYNAAAAYRQLLTTAHQWSLAGTDHLGNDWTFQITTQPLAAGTFAPTGVAAGRLALTTAAAAAGMSDSATMTYYYDSAGSARNLLGIEMPDGSCAVAGLFNAPPADATVGESGLLTTMSLHASCVPGASSLGTVDDRWSIARDGALVLFCLSSGDGSGSGESDCLEMATDGSLGTHARVTLTMPNFRLVAKNY